jgi:hypothetical protein
MENKQSPFVPLGGMNQDDALITPSFNNAGDSLFTQGDYRYALNARIGSSHNGNAQDVENILGTLKVTDYYASNQLFSNPGFALSLNPWSQHDDGPGYTAWSYYSPSITSFLARVQFTASTFNSRILYQTGMTFGDDVIIRIGRMSVASYTGGSYTAYVKILFLQGTTILSEEIIPFADMLLKSHTDTYDVPTGCDGLGIRVYGTKSGSDTLDIRLDIVNAYTFTPGAIPAGTNKIIGRLESPEFQRVYFCNYNSNDNHTVGYYDHGTGRVYELIKWNFNWLATTHVSMAMLDNWLALTDKRNAPRLIDVDNIVELFKSLGSSFREFHLAFHKWSPIAPPVPRVYYDLTTNNFEFLKNKIYHFAYRYVYKGNLKSRWSPISKGAITTKCGNYYSVSLTPTSDRITSIEVEVPVMILDTEGAATEYNYFGYDSEKFTLAVIGIELAYREGELELWKKWKNVPTEDFAQYYYFDGKSANQTPIPDDDFEQQFDAVPFLAGAVEAIDNRFVFADCMDELEPVETLSITNVSVVTDPSDDWNDSMRYTTSRSFSQFSGNLSDRLLKMNSLSDFTVKPRGMYKLGIIFLHHSGWRSLVYTNDEWVFELDQDSGPDLSRIHAFRFVFGPNFRPPSWAVGYQIVRTNCLNIDYFLYGNINQVIPLIDDFNQAVDGLSVSDGVKNTILEHLHNAQTTNGYEAAQIAEDTIKKDPIQRIFLEAKKKMNKFLSRNPITNKIAQHIRVTLAVDTFDSASRLAFDIDNWYNAARTGAASNAPMNKLFYNYRPGDRLRFIGAATASPTDEQLQVYDVPILEFSGRELIVEKPVGMLWCIGRGTYNNITHSDGFYIEVYTPNTPTEDDHLFFETGEFYPVLYPGTESRDFSKRDWNYTANSAVTSDTYGPFDVFHKMPFYYGDVSHISKTAYRSTFTPFTGAASATIRYSMNPDKTQTYEYWDKNNGRPSVAYRDLPTVRFKPTQARFGQRIIEESKINQLNRFRQQDSIVYPTEYGRIRGMVNTSNAQVESSGSILLMIGERESWSVYVNRNTLEDLSGETLVMQSRKVLGSYNTLLGSHGTLNPESVSKERGNVYWWDALAGCWIRYGRDGLTEISGYKMRSWFRQIGKLLLPTYQTDTPPRVISDFDGMHEELVTRIDHASLPATFRGYSNYKGVTFNEDHKRWKTCHTWNPEFFAKIGTQMLMFLNGEVYLHEQGENYSEFLGAAKAGVQIEPVFNTDSKDAKHWLTLAVIATDKWSAALESEYRGSQSLIASSLSLAEFEGREDGYWADIKRNSNTPDVSNARLEGHPVTCRALKVLLTLDPDVEGLSLLHYVFAGYKDSPKNP